jgi:hypothetical protein
MKVVPAIHKERPRAFAEMGLSRIELGKMGDELDGGVALPDGKDFEPFEERLIRQSGDGSEDVFLHDPV